MPLDEAALLRRIETLEAHVAILNAMLDPGNPNGFLSFGRSASIKNQRLQGYNRQHDILLAGDGVMIENLNDAPNIWFRRRGTDATSTGFSNSEQIGRIGATPMDKNTDNQYFWDNGTDGEIAHLIFRLILRQNGNTKVGGFGVIEMHVVDSRSKASDPHPFMLSEFSGERGGRWIYHGFNSDGSRCDKVIAQPDY